MLVQGNVKWHESSDVIVIGYGLAGAVAAITARDLGAAVTILEKQSMASHCTSIPVYMPPENAALSTGCFTRQEEAILRSVSLSGALPQSVR